MRLRFLAPLAMAAALASPMAAQRARCTTLPDSTRGPSAGQLREIAELRRRLIAVGQRHGVVAPQGLLLVDVDSARRGQLLFMETNYPEPAVKQVTDSVASYLQSLPGGRGYQALLRVEGDYPVMAPGREHCGPALYTANDERLELIHAAERAHPDAGRLAAQVQKQVLVLLVVSRAGGVAYAAVSRSSGDAYLDEAALRIGRAMRFSPATLDGVPFDMRIRLPLNFVIE